MRQLRVQSGQSIVFTEIVWLRIVVICLGSCSSKVREFNLTTSCENDYTFSDEDTNSYLPGWIQNTTINNFTTSITKAFQYQSGDQLDTYPYIGSLAEYGSGGYVYEFRGSLINLQSNLSELYRLNWIDGKTRAIIIQMSLYNPNIQLFTSVTLLVEVISTGQLISSSRFEPIDLQSKITR